MARQRGSPLTRWWAFAPGENQRFACLRAKSIQERPGAASTAQEQPMDAVEASGASRSSQRQPRNQPRTLRKSQRQPRSSQEQPADSQEPPGAARSSQEQPGATEAGFSVPGGLGLASQGDPSQEATLRSHGAKGLRFRVLLFLLRSRGEGA